MIKLLGWFQFELCYLMAPGLRIFGVIYDDILFQLTNHQIKHHATHKVDCHNLT